MPAAEYCESRYAVGCNHGVRGCKEWSGDLAHTPVFLELLPLLYILPWSRWRGAELRQLCGPATAFYIRESGRMKSGDKAAIFHMSVCYKYLRE